MLADSQPAFVAVVDLTFCSLMVKTKPAARLSALPVAVAVSPAAVRCAPPLVRP